MCLYTRLYLSVVVYLTPYTHINRVVVCLMKTKKRYVKLVLKDRSFSSIDRIL